MIHNFNLSDKFYKLSLEEIKSLVYVNYLELFE